MALNKLVDTRDCRFVLFEMLEVDKLNKFPKYADMDRDTLEATLDLAEQIAMEQVYPSNTIADKEGVKYNPDTKEVKVPEAYKPAMKAYHEAGFISLAIEPEFGGMGLPEVLFQSCTEYFTAACVAFTMYPMLTIGAANMIKTFGTPEQKATYLPKMYTGEWGGTMCLTEPDAGSDVGALKSKAIKQADGTYKISGTKIFISSGDNDIYKNVIHPVLARIEGDPGGTKGISIFIVPKFLINKDGSLGKQNDVVCAGIEHKMGIKGSATCTMSFGDNGNCVGYLLGDERKGMKIMFQMMNEARIFVGNQGLAVSSAAYMHAITYAKNRLQGAHVTQMLNPEAKSVNIIQHPDVRRMLLWMKSNVEAMRMISYFVGYNLDYMHVAEGEAKKEAQALVEIMIPICKAGNTDLSWLVTAEACQVYGGYGFCSDYPVEQLARDSKILSIYEGTNGIQSMDLTMRKILMNPELYNYSILKKKILETCAKAKGVAEDKYIDLVKKGVEKMDEVIKKMKDQMAGGKFLHLFSSATPLQVSFRYLTHAWMHLWALTLATPKMKALVGDKKGAERDALLKDNAEAAYYSGKVLSAQFYIGNEFHRYFGQIDYLLSEEAAVVKTSDEIFTGAPAE
jgi:alkylation response protein AidB-like acyl-CoA dehydrogenase